MRITVRTHHVAITPALKEYAEKKAEKLKRFFENIQEVLIELDISDASAERSRQVASAVLKCSGSTIRATETSESMYASIDQLLDKLGIQLRKHKEKLKDRQKGPGKEMVMTGEMPVKVPFKRAAPRTESHYDPKPIAPEDAVMFLQEKNLAFIMFRNLHTEEINVMYSSGRGLYNLIEP